MSDPASEIQATPSLLKRRSVLSGVGATTLIAASGALEMPAAWAGPKTTTGFRVGQVFPQLGGRDQYNASASIRNRDPVWRLLDVCAWWCPPCRQSAGVHRAFIDYVRSKGVPFELVTVIVEPFTLEPADRKWAEGWATAFGLTPDKVLHPAGDFGSPLYSLVEAISAANGAETAIPCYLLLDPSGVIRLHKTGFALPDAQQVIAAATGKSLDRVWEPDDNFDIDFTNEIPLTPAHVRGKTSDGRTIDESVRANSTAGDLVLQQDSQIWVIDEDWANGSRTLGFDIDVPITIRFSFDSMQWDNALAYRLGYEGLTRPWTLLSATESLGEIPITPTVTLQSDAVLYEFSPLRAALSGIPDPDAHIYDTLANAPSLVGEPAFTSSEKFVAQVNADQSLAPSIKDSSLKLLTAIQTRMGQRDFADAAAKANKLANVPWNSHGYRIHSRSLADHLSMLAAQGPALAAIRLTGATARATQRSLRRR